MIALCLGGAKTVWGDLRAAQTLLGEREHVMVACNYAGIAYPGHLDAWATLHPERFDEWRRERARVGRNTDYRAFAHTVGGEEPLEVLAYRLYGSSGLYAAQVALEAMDARGAILCGMPMDDTGSHIHWQGAWAACHHYQAAFAAAEKAGMPIRSMSGWSAELFNRPNAAWIEELSR